jgi:hypothetical protein
MKRSIDVPQKLKVEMPCDPVILLDICPKEHKAGYNGDTYTLIFIAALFTTNKVWKQPR